jgi:hypothetical protein
MGNVKANFPGIPEKTGTGKPGKETLGEREGNGERATNEGWKKKKRKRKKVWKCGS